MAVPFYCCNMIESIVDRKFTVYNQEQRYVFAKKDIKKKIFLQNFQNSSERIYNYKLGGGIETKTKNAEEVYDFLLKRDHYCIYSIDQIGTIQNGTTQTETSYNSIGGIFVPPDFFSVCPRIMQPENMSKFEKLVKTFKESTDDEEKTSLYEQLCSLVARKKERLIKSPAVLDDTKIDNTFDGLTRALHGDISERKVFDTLKMYFNENNEDALIIHSHVFNVGNQENDFIIVNLTKGYIMIIDVKYVLHKASIEKGVKQIKKASHIIKQQIGEDLNSWTFIGLIVGMKHHDKIKVLFNIEFVQQTKETG